MKDFSIGGDQNPVGVAIFSAREMTIDFTRVL
jgi:hypothetical protein